MADAAWALLRASVNQPRPSSAPTSTRAPAGATPEKCDLEMSPSGFRTWRRSVEAWLQLANWQDKMAVLHIRLLCKPSLQTVLDARFTSRQWNALTPDGALDAIGRLVLRAENQAVRWSEFFSGKQAHSETVSAYVTRCGQDALDCGFACPHCNGDLSDYVLLRKVVSGLSDSAMRQEVFRRYTTLDSIEKLRSFCDIYEAAQRDAMKLRAVAANDVIPDDVTEQGGREPEAAAARAPPSRPCRGCGGRHERKTCFARALACNKCGKTGHIAKVCRSNPSDKNAADTEVSISGVLVAASVGVLDHPTIEVTVTPQAAQVSRVLAAVADTGAQVCVAGTRHLPTLGLRPAMLHRRAGIRDLAQVRLRCAGTARCRIELPDRYTVQEVYFIDDVERLYLSRAACTDLGLVPRDFPNPLPLVAALDTGLSDTQPPRPASIPHQPLEENVPRLEEWLLRHFSATTFNTERRPLRMMSGAPHHIHLKEGATPVACHTPATIPKHWEAEVKRQLDEDVMAGIIRPVPAGEATEWCARMVVVPKKSGKPRRTVDFQKLNVCCLRETHHTPTPFDMVSDVPPRSFKTVVDAHWGFHQVELDEESRKLTTFITPWGRYQYCRTPMGHCSASDAYTKRFDDAVCDFPRKHKCVDDTLLYDEGVEEAFWHTYAFLELCAERGITLNPEKFRFCRRDIDFVGYHLSWEGYRPTDDRLAAIRDFKMPTQPTITDVRSWYGFVNQVAPFVATAPVMEPFRDLLKHPTSKKVYWDAQLENKMEIAKDVICRLAKDGLAYYERNRPTAVITDWSKEGLGFVILQQHCGCVTTDVPFCCKDGWRLALCGSRHLTPAETGYAPVEGEALAVAWCLHKARLFLLGCPNLTLVTDHRPLVGLLGDKALADISNPRLFRLKERTLIYQFTIRYLPGKKNCAADFLSRYPALRAQPDTLDEDLDTDIQVATVTAIAAALDVSECLTLDEDAVAQSAHDDPEYQMLVAKVSNGDWHRSRAQEASCLRPYYHVRERLATSGGLVTYAFDLNHLRIVIPGALRPQVTERLHAGHQGLDSMLRRARQAVYWPGIEGDLQHHRQSCTTCNTNAPSQPEEPLVLTPPPEYPFQQTVVDLCQIGGHTYLVYADRLTGWLEVAHMPDGATARATRDILRRYFGRWGAPEQLSLDGGTNLVAHEMMEFYERWRVTVRQSSAHYPQSNGRAEAAVKSAKRTIRDHTGRDGSLDSDRLSLAILQYLNTPLRGTDKSPAQLATGRQLRDGVPTARSKLLVDQQWGYTLRARERQMTRHNAAVRERQGDVRTLRALRAGERVMVQDQQSRLWNRTGTVIESRGTRQYTVRLDGSGRVTMRTRRHLRPTFVEAVTSEGSCEQLRPTPADQPPAALSLPATHTAPPTSPNLPGPSTGGRKRRPPSWLSDYAP